MKRQKSKHGIVHLLCLALALLTMVSIDGLAQTSSGTSLLGVVRDEVTGETISGVRVALQTNAVQAVTDQNGAFTLTGLSTPGNDKLTISGANINPVEMVVEIQPNVPNNLGLIDVRQNTQAASHDAFTGVVDDQMLMMDEDEGTAGQNISSTVIFSNDVFLKNTGFRFSPFRYRVRGYESRYEEKFINGVTFNDQVRGMFNYSAIGALNDMTRNGDAVNYFNPSTFTFGSIGGAENINMRAGSFAKGGKLTLSGANRNYYARGMVTLASGMQDSGWAWALSVGGRYAHRGFIPGTFYKNIAYAFSLEKEWDMGRHSLSFVTFGSPVERGQQGSSTQEVYDLVGDNLYNPNWGYQNKKFRNSRVVRAFDPTAILSYVWQINDFTTLTTGLGYHYNRYGSSALNWYNGPDPRPDYYRYLPSYNTGDPKVDDYYHYLWTRTCGWKRTTQINWDKLYEINAINNKTGDGSAIYMMEERRRDLQEFSFNSTLQARLSDRVKLTAGIGAMNSLALQFKTVDDLMGAKHLLDIDKFAERDFPGNRSTIQNDLERPDRKVYEGDIFGYDFRYHINSANIWFQQEHNYNKIDLYYGGKLKYTSYQREGKMRNGRYPYESLGKGKEHVFIDYAAKIGLKYKFDGRHYLVLNTSYQSVAPLIDNAYISPRITDRSADNIHSAGILSADLSYVFSLPYLSGRASIFQTNIYNELLKTSYYHDAERTFVNQQMEDVNKIYRGIELGMNLRINNNWNIDLVGSTAEYFYANNPKGTINYENGKGEAKSETVYLKNAMLGGVPQTIGTVGINYFYDYWFLSLNFNGVGRNFVEVSPIRRMASNYEGITPPGTPGHDEALYEAYQWLTTQEQFDSAFTMDFSIGKIFYLKNRKSINFNFSLNNLLNNKKIKTGGYEQGRINLEYPKRFGNKYFYMQGFSCFLNASYRF